MSYHEYFTQMSQLKKIVVAINYFEDFPYRCCVTKLKDYTEALTTIKGIHLLLFVLFICICHLNIPLEVAGDERPEAPSEGQPVVMRKHHSSVEDGGVDEI